MDADPVAAPVRTGGASCGVFGCHNRWSNTKGKHFFRFPKNPRRSEIWLTNIRRPDLRKTSTEYRRNNIRVCSEHFTRESFMNDDKKKLHWNAVPTIFTFLPYECHQAMISAAILDNAPPRSHKGGTYCAAIDCKSRSGVTGLHFFRFPKEVTRNVRWCVNVGRKDLECDTPVYRNRNLMLCNQHFTRECFMNDKRNSLTQSAVPTIFSFPSGKFQQRPSSLGRFSRRAYPTATRSLIEHDYIKRSVNKRTLYGRRWLAAQHGKMSLMTLHMAAIKVETDAKLLGLPASEIKTASSAIEYCDVKVKIEPFDPATVAPPAGSHMNVKLDFNKLIDSQPIRDNSPTRWIVEHGVLVQMSPSLLD